MRTKQLVTIIAVLLSLFTLAEVNAAQLARSSQLSLFALMGLVLCFLTRPLHPKLKDAAWSRYLDAFFALCAVLVCGYVFVHNEPLLKSFWIDGQSLGDRAGQEGPIDWAVGALGLIVILEATRRAIGWALPILSLIFIGYAMFGPHLPDFLFPHRGYSITRIISQAFLQSQGVFGTALRVMFTYVFIFVIFGALLKQTGATQYVIDFAQRMFGKSAGGPAKVSVVSSGLMGSLSGSAVANTATTGTFTIPMMKSSGFSPEVAGGVEAAASSGGALVPPVMGAGAYMMLEIVRPSVTYLEILRAALIPAILYYLSLLLIVHFHAKKIGTKETETKDGAPPGQWRDYSGFVFIAAFALLISLLLSGYTVMRSVSVALLAILAVASVNSKTRIGPRKLLSALREAGRDVVPLVSAAACVGIIIGMVTLTGVGSKLPTTILSVAQDNLFMALVLIMVSSIILGMGLPSAVCYLLMATLVGPVLGKLGVVPLAAHLFIFYFGMMSMVTPPVALAAYTAGSIAQADVMRTGFAAFRFALVGFTLPYMFVFRPELLMLAPDGTSAGIVPILIATGVASVGILAFAAGVAGYLLAPLQTVLRLFVIGAAVLLLLPGAAVLSWIGVAMLAITFALSYRSSKQLAAA